MLWRSLFSRQATIPSKRAESEKNRVPAMALFFKNAWCIAGKRSEAVARTVRELPKTMESAFALDF